jgi:ribosomal protein S12 methylthiotransferase accessory factor
MLARSHTLCDPRLVETINKLVNPRHGIVRHIAEMPAFPDTPPLFVANTVMVNPIHFRTGPDAAREHVTGSSGAGLGRSECLWAAIGEAIERYSGSIYFDDDLLIATADELGTDAVAVDDFVLYGEEQYEAPSFPFARFKPELSRRWARGVRLLTGEPVLVPAQMVWLGYTMQAPHEYLLQSVSSGLGTGNSLENAIFAGLREVIERDAVLSHWLLRVPGRRITLSADQIALFPEGFGSLVDSPHAEVVLRLLENEFSIPVAFAIVQDRISRHIAIGAACHPELVSAICKATVEAWHTRYWALELERSKSGKLAPEDVTTFSAHVRYYRDPDHIENVEFLLNGAAHPVALTERFDGDFAAANRRMAMLLKEAGYDVIVIDVTTADVAEVGLHVARVLVPGLQPLYSGMGARSTDPKRLRKVARHLNRGEPIEINSAPHPFP